MVRGYCGALLTSSNESTFNVTDANTGTSYIKDAKITSAGGQISSLDMSFTLDTAIKLQISVAGKLNALLIDQVVPVTLAPVDKVSVASKVITVGNSEKIKVTLPSSLELSMSALDKDVNKALVQFESSDKTVADITKTGVVIARKKALQKSPQL